MPRAASTAESWKQMVLRSMAPPAWLAPDAPGDDVVLSTRSRVLRNLRGFRFPHAATPEELEQVMVLVLGSNPVAHRSRRATLGLPTFDGLEVMKRLSLAERSYLVGCRLASPDFRWREPGRALLLDATRSTSIMVNEEDHIRLQTLTPGWSLNDAEALVAARLDFLSRRLEFAHSPEFGYLAASPYNAGEGKRVSAMFHLIGLAHTRRLTTVMRALASAGVAVRGLFGESSRAVGAFVQVSMTGGSHQQFVGACEYLLREERAARAMTDRRLLADKFREVREYAVRSRGLTLADGLRVLAWMRWAAAELPGIGFGHRDVDGWLTVLELRGPAETSAAAGARARFIRSLVETG